ncbi:MAG: hypothetical protein ABI663_17550 [Chryseolinea sp.]
MRAPCFYLASGILWRFDIDAMRSYVDATRSYGDAITMLSACNLVQMM